jgi:hypothetical protein
MMTGLLQGDIDERLGLIQSAIDHLNAGDGTAADLQSIKSCLHQIIELIEPDAVIQAASDDLCRVAIVVVEGPVRGREGSLLLTEAFQRFLERLMG